MYQISIYKGRLLYQSVGYIFNFVCLVSVLAMMFGSEIFKFRPNDFQELINELCDSCSYNLNSRGIKLLEETASAISVAVAKLTELEEFIADSKKCNTNEESEGNKQALMSLMCIPTSDPRERNILKQDLLEHSIYFCINENVAENHIIEALNKAGISNFSIDKLINRINFAYGYMSFNDEESYESVTLPHEIRVGNSILRIIPRKRAPSIDNVKRQKKRKKQKQNVSTSKL